VPDLEYANNHAGEGEDYESGKDCGGGFFTGSHLFVLMRLLLPFYTAVTEPW